MPRYLISEPAEVILAALGDALDLVNFGIVLLNSALRACFVNGRRSRRGKCPKGGECLPAA
jgi:hypothetical protein